MSCVVYSDYFFPGDTQAAFESACFGYNYHTVFNQEINVHCHPPSVVQDHKELILRDDNKETERLGGRLSVSPSPLETSISMLWNSTKESDKWVRHLSIPQAARV